MEMAEGPEEEYMYGDILSQLSKSINLYSIHVIIPRNISKI